MGRRQLPPNTIRLNIDGPEITADKFTRTVRTFFELISDVTAGVAGRRNAVEWIVSVEQGSIGVCATARVTNGDRRLAQRTVRAIDDGIQAVSTRQKRPEYFSDTALQRLFQLGSVVGLGNEGVSSIRIGVKQKWKDISPSSVAYVDELLGTPTKAYGTVEGRLLALNVKGRLTFSVTETPTGKDVKCFFSDAVYDEVIAAIRKRVAAYGLIRYRKNGQPASVDIEQLTVFRGQSELPQFKDIIGLLK